MSKALWTQLPQYQQLPVIKQQCRIGRSKSMTARMAVYKNVKAQFLADHPECQVCLAEEQMNRPSQSTEIHHRRGRVGTNLTDISTFVSICGRHHRYIHDNPEWSYKHRWMIRR